jgi:II/X family phage/plasmid replication protein
LCWHIVGDGLEYYLSIGASPASLQYGINVFGSDDIKECAAILINTCQKALDCILPPLEKWQCRRIDVTFNYRMQSLQQVRQALREFRKGDGTRQKASVPKGDTVVWGQGSDLISGKAYAKGPQLRYLQKRRKDGFEVADDTLDLADSLLRLELSLRSRWFRRLKTNWFDLTTEQLTKFHADYFGKFIGKIEVTDMGTLLQELEKVTPTKGRALAAHRTWALIKSIGYETTKESMPKTTWFAHVAYLRAAGVSQADLMTGNVIPFRRDTISLGQAVTSWEELRRAA